MTLDEFKKLFEDLDTNEYKLLEPLMEETYKLRKEIEYLGSLPQIMVKPDMPEVQKITEAAKQKNKLSQLYKEQVRLLLQALRRESLDGESPLMKMLSKFEQESSKF